MDTRRARRGLVRAVVALASAATLGATGTGWVLQRQLDARIVTSEVLAAPAPAPGAAFTALLVGLDARTDASGNPLPPTLLQQLHAGPDEGQLHTDTIILLHVPAEPGAPAVGISIPRDSFVPIAGDRGTHKINSAYRRGMQDAERRLTADGVTGAGLDRRGREAGRRTLVETVEALTGVTVDHYAEINLAGFVELTDALGGVPVCLSEPASDPYSGVDLPAGPSQVSGATALAFVRQRHGLDGGDLDRIARQQAFLAGLAQRLLAAGTLSDPQRLGELVAVLTRHLVIDRGWNLDQVLAQLGRFDRADLTLRTIPTGAPDLRTPVDGIAVQVDPDAVRAFVLAAIPGQGAQPPPSPGGAAPATGDPAGPTGAPASGHSGAPSAIRVARPPASWPLGPAGPPPAAGDSAPATAGALPATAPVPSTAGHPVAMPTPSGSAPTPVRVINGAGVPCVR